MIAGEPQESHIVHEPTISLVGLRTLIKRASAGPQPPSFLHKVFQYMSDERRALAFILTTALLEALLSLLPPWIASNAIDVALPNSAPSMLKLFAIGTVAAVAFTAWAGWLNDRASVVLQERLMARAQRELMRRYLKTSFGELQTTEFGPTKVTFAAASTLVRTATGAVADMMTQSATAIAAVVMLGTYFVGLAAIAFALSFVASCVATLLAVREMSYARQNMGASSQAEQLLHMLLRAVPTLRAFHATERLVGRWIDRCHAQAQQAIGMETTRLARAALFLAAQQAMTWSATVWLAKQAMDGAVSVGAMISCTMLVNQVLRATVNVTQSALSVFVLRPIAKRVDALSKNSEREIPARESAKTYALHSRSVQLRQVWYRYQISEPWVLQNYSVDYESRSTTILRSASGTGKSTLLRLVAGLLTPDHGRVIVCGHDPAATADLVTYVPQQSLLLDSSIAQNLDTLSGGRLKHALITAESTGLARLLETLPMGVETLISGAGSNLSAGQRQLVTLTAALATEQPVVLLDEATSQLDELSRNRIQWDVLTKDRTVISVQHI